MWYLLLDISRKHNLLNTHSVSVTLIITKFRYAYNFLVSLKSIIVLYIWLHLWFFVSTSKSNSSFCMFMILTSFECQWLKNAWLPSITFQCSKQLVGYTVVFLCAYLATCVWKLALRIRETTKMPFFCTSSHILPSLKYYFLIIPNHIVLILRFPIAFHF